MTSWEDKELYKILLISLQVSQILDIILLTVHLDINSKYPIKKKTDFIRLLQTVIMHFFNIVDLKKNTFLNLFKFKSNPEKLIILIISFIILFHIS